VTQENQMDVNTNKDSVTTFCQRAEQNYNYLKTVIELSNPQERYLLLTK